MTVHHKENRGVLLYALIFFVSLTIAAFSLLIQLQTSSKSAVEFFEPLQINIDNLYD